MTQDSAIKKLALSLAIETGTMEDLPIYRKYIQMALCVGMEHFRRDQEEIIAIDRDGIEYGRFKTAREASEKLGIDRRNIQHVLKGEKYSAGGYLFVKKTEQELIKIPEKVKQKLTEAHFLEIAKYR